MLWSQGLDDTLLFSCLFLILLFETIYEACDVGVVLFRQLPAWLILGATQQFCRFQEADNCRRAILRNGIEQVSFGVLEVGNGGIRRE